ncbi:helix-turn-helix transcriptional regulator [Marinobacter sp.]|uniref:helix-turn-helix transcriptional regulator n=1 Tax=Marinobacter sp. TaxID=50741 RepID=UPI003A94AE3D
MQTTLLNTKQAAEFLGVSCAFLERDRCYTGRIRFIKVGSRAVRYRPDDLNQFIENQIRTSTSHVAVSL